jgi:hypothetical protein
VAFRAHNVAPPRTLPSVALTPLAIRTLKPRKPQSERELVDRVRGEFNEMRGFSPTLEQAARLFNLTKDDCQQIFARLQLEGFLSRGSDGRYRLA